MNCEHALQMKGAEGVQSGGKSAETERERERDISKRHRHVQDSMEELSNVRCAFIRDFSDD